MFSVVELDGKTYNYVTQQYAIGTYCIINNNPALQFCANCKEEDFHKKLRIKTLKKGGSIIDGSCIVYKFRKYNINAFKNKR